VVEAELRTMPIYKNEISWQTFVPPLPVHQVRPDREVRHQGEAAISQLAYYRT